MVKALKRATTVQDNMAVELSSLRQALNQNMATEMIKMKEAIKVFSRSIDTNKKGERTEEIKGRRVQGEERSPRSADEPSRPLVIEGERLQRSVDKRRAEAERRSKKQKHDTPKVLHKDFPSKRGRRE